MREITLRLRSGGCDIKMTIQGNTEQQAKAMARAIARLWPSATQTEKQTLEKMLKANLPMEYAVLEGNALGNFLKEHKGGDYLIRRDDWGRHHIIFTAAMKKTAKPYEARAIRQLRKKQLEMAGVRLQKQRYRVTQKDNIPTGVVQPLMPEMQAEDISIQIKKEMMPLVVGIQKDMAEMQREIERLKEEQ